MYEVRNAVALAIKYLHDPAFDRIVAVLAADPSDDVQRAASASLRSRRRATRLQNEPMDDQGRVRRELEDLAARHPRLVGRIRDLVQTSFFRAAEQTAHDVRAVIMSLDHYLAGLRKDLEARKVPVSVWRERLEETKAGHRLIGDILGDVTEFSSAAPKELARVNVLAAVSRAVELERKRAPTTARVEAAIDPDLAIEATLHGLVRMFQNAVRNALEAGASSVNVSARVEDGQVTLLVVDDGRGVFTEDLGRVFDWGFSTKRNQRPSTDHSGRGLKIVRKLVEELQGEVWLESEEGKGATLTFVLPLEQDRADGDEP